MSFKIEEIKGVGEKTKNILNEIGVFTTDDLLLNFPKNYLHFTNHNNLTFKNHNEVVSIFVKVSSDLSINHYTNSKIIKFEVVLNEKAINIVAFNQLYLMKTIKKDSEIYITGKYNYYKNEIVLSKVSTHNKFKNIEPKYNFDNLLDSNISKIVKNILTENKFNIKENLPQYVINKYNLNNRIKTLKELHNPINEESLNSAIKRMKYEEAFNFQTEMIKRINVEVKRPPIKYNNDKVRTLISKFPFKLTKDQKLAVNDIFRDFKTNKTTYRLIQGDVGSGKTVVAMLAIYGALTAGKQVLFMAPTEILAKQHFESIIKYFDNEFNSELLTSSTKNKEEIKVKLLQNEINFIVGTHALAEDDVIFNDLALIIIDEQHKFGVNVRNKVLKKGNANLIYLTATPIPRTLAISIYGDAKISLIKEKPAQRKKIITKYITNNKIDEVINHIKITINNNEKVYIVVPAISSTHAKYNVENVYLAIKRRLPNYNNIYKIHGKYNKNEQEESINNFLKDENAILVATSMIEVGIDVKNATLMVIFAANYFGLSQLHQLRGRVGRSNLQSYCYLISEREDEERLSIIEKVDDGFELSEYDLKLRGPGIFLGYDQTGHFNFKYLDFIEDYNILINVRDDIINDNKNMI